MPDFQQRQRAVSEQLGSSKVEALVVTSPANVRYLTGYSGSNGLVLVAGTDIHFFTDPRYGAEATATIPCKVHVAKGPLIPAAASTLKRKRVRKIGFEPAWMNVEQFDALQKALSVQKAKGPALVPVSGLVENLRAIKSPEELELIRRSVVANSEALRRTLEQLKPGLRELEIAAELEFQMKALGCEKPAFDTIVAAGERSALPHAHPTQYQFHQNELLLIDMGATLDGYTSDMTRMVHSGTPSKRVRDLHGAVLEAQLAGLDAVRSGASVKNVDAAARDVLKSHNLDKEFVHSTGHGLGLEIHEQPRIGKTGKGKLRAGMVITIEPGAYLQGFGGVRIEDTVLVTQTGCEILTPTPKELFIL